jgi:hypothetical protein
MLKTEHFHLFIWKIFEKHLSLRHEFYHSITKATSNEEQNHHLSKQRASGFVADITCL